MASAPCHIERDNTVKVARDSVERQSRLFGTITASLVVVAIIGQMPFSFATTGAPRATAQIAPAASNSVITFGVQPAGPKKPDGRSYFSFVVTDGAHISDHIAVTNYSFQRLTLSLHASDALNTPQGDFALLPPNQRSTQVGKWIKLHSSKKKVVIPARGTVIVPFTVVVPHKAEPGDHAGGIIATLESSARSPTGQLYHLLQNVGARVFIRVSGVLRPSLTVEGVRVGYRGTLNPVGKGSTRVTFTVHNSGNVAFGGIQSVEVSGLFGLSSSAKGLKQLGLLLPGSRVTETVDVHGDFPQFMMKAHVSIKPLSLPGAVQTAPGPFEASKRFWVIPWMLLLLAALLIALVWWMRAHRRKPTQARRGPEVKKAGDAISEEAGLAQPATGI